MRSVVVVLPASMCAMMPMLRTLVRSVSTSSATGDSLQSIRMRTTRRRLPAVVREGPVGLGHLVGVLAALDRGTEAVGGVEDLVHEALGHRLLATGAGVVHQPAQSQGGLTRRTDLDGHLVGGATDAAGADLERGAHVLERALEDGGRVAVGLRPDALEGVVDDPLGGRLLTVPEDAVDELRDDRGPVDRVDDERPLRGGALARHYFFSFFAP